MENAPRHISGRHIISICALLVALPLGAATTGCELGTMSVEEAPPPSTPVDEERPPPMFPEEPEEPVGGPTPMRLLTRYEYDNTVRDLLGVDGTYTGAFPSENLADGFENNAYTHRVNPQLLRNYMEASEVISSEAVSERRDELLRGCDPQSEGLETCRDRFVRGLTARAFRRAPYDDELQIFTTLFDRAHETYGLDRAMQMVVQAVLQSPQFLYRIELPVEGDEPGVTRKLRAHELAVRLSYFLWNSMPDEELFEAAALGELETRAQIEAQVRRMLDDPRAESTVRNFHRQWLGLDKFDSMTKNEDAFPDYGDSMPDDWRASVERFIEYTFLEEGRLEAMLSSPKVFLTPELAALYGIDDAEAGLHGYQLTGDERAGILTQPGMMALLANTDQSSPIRRGIFVRERMLCQELPPPPNDVEIEPPDPDPNATTRERFKVHTEEPSCAGCHKMIDPVGFGFENYDGVGRFRANENGKAIDNSGAVHSFGSDEDVTGPFNGAVELSKRLTHSATVHDCIARRWYEYALGRHVSDADEWSIRRVQKTFRDEEGSFRELIVAIALSDAFRYVTIPEQDGGMSE